MKRIMYADDDKNTVKRLIQLRAPSILVGLLLGILLSFAFSRFEQVLSKDIRVAFFIPFVVYIAAAVGAQTQSIFARDLKSGHANFKKYLAKETLVGLVLGTMAAAASCLIAFVWVGEPMLALVVGLSMFTAVTIAPLVALFVTESLQVEHLDPAVGSGPIATVIQDTLSVLIYGGIASYFLL